MPDFERFWVKGNLPSGYEEDDDGGDEIPPGVTGAQVMAWERRHGVTLPALLREALGRRDGGYVRNTGIHVLPLGEIVPVDDDFWQFADLDEDEAPDHALMFVFGHDTEVGGTYLLNFNTRGRDGVPGVYIDHHGESIDRIDDSLEGFFEAQLASSAVPDVDWSEAKEDLPVVARETIDLSALYQARASKEQVLVRQGGALVLVTREQFPGGERLTRTTLPLPLDAPGARVAPLRPAPGATFALHLQPAESAGIVHQESTTTDDGRWKNETSRGVPIYAQFESTDRDRLRAFRSQLLGAAGAPRAQAGEDREAGLREALDALPPGERTASLLHVALKMRGEADRRFAAQAGDPGSAPPELAQAAEAIRRKLDEAVGRARDAVARNPPAPETLRRIEEGFRDRVGDPDTP